MRAEEHPGGKASSRDELGSGKLLFGDEAARSRNGVCCDTDVSVVPEVLVGASSGTEQDMPPLFVDDAVPALPDLVAPSQCQDMALAVRRARAEAFEVTPSF